MIPGQSRTRAAAAQEQLTAAATLARDTGLAVAVVLPRERDVVAQARAAAREANVAVAAVIKAHTVCIRFTLQDAG